MSSNISITATGVIVNEPVHFKKTEEKSAMTSFRIASTPGYYDKKKSEWVNGTTTWFDVTTRGSLAEHVAESFQKSDPVFVSGVMTTRKWESKKAEGEGYSNVISATSAGHNLLGGTTVYTRKSAADDAIAASLEADTSETPSKK